MASDYIGSAGGATQTLSLMTDSDSPSAALFRVPLERLLDNDAARLAETSSLEVQANRERLRTLLFMQPLDVTVDDTAESMGATLADNAAPHGAVVLCKVDSIGVPQAYDGPEVDQGGVVASVTSLVRDAATSGARIAAIGTGGNLATYSSNGGGAWSAGGAGIGGAVQYLVYMQPNALVGGGSMFFCGGSGTGSVYRSPDISTVWDALASSFAAVLGLAVLGGSTGNAGYCVALGASGIEPRMSVLTDGGNGGDFTGTQTPPSANTAEEPGWIAGAPLVPLAGDAVYHVMRCNAGARLRTAKATNGTTWVASTTIESPTGTVFASRPRLLICQSTGLQVIAVPTDVGSVALYASSDFTDWVGPVFVRSVEIEAFAMAGGKLFYTRNAKIFGSFRAPPAFTL